MTPAALLAKEQAKPKAVGYSTVTAWEPGGLTFTATLPLRLGRGGNDRMHWRTRDRQKKAEREAVGWLLSTERGDRLPPCHVVLTRIAPGNGLDDDNLTGSLKHVRDSIAEWLGVDDKHADIVRYVCQQERGPWGVRIVITSKGNHG